VYKEFYHLKQDPFRLTPDPYFICLTAQHREALSGLVYSVMSRPGLTLLVGEAGTGKTTLLYTLRKLLEKRQACVALCVNPTLTPDEFYDVSRLAIVPMGFCFPGLDAKGGDLPPRRECAEAWREQLFKLLPQIELTLLVGQYAQAWHLGGARKESLTATVAAWREYGPHFIPLPHPSWRNNAWIRKNPWFEAELLPVLRSEVRRLMG